MERCPKCGYMEIPVIGSDVFEKRLKRELLYMLKNKDCRFPALADLPDAYLDDTLRTMIDRGLVERRKDGFYPTSAAVQVFSITSNPNSATESET